MPDASTPQILIVDDHTLIRDGVRRAIGRRLPGAVCEFAATAAAALAAVERQAWSLVVLDLGLPGDDGEMGTLRRLRTLRPELPILVLSMFPEEKMGLAAIESGASGYLCKTAERATIEEAATTVLAGRRYCSAKLHSLLEARPARGSRSGLAALSARELDVLLAVARGESNKEISARLNVGVTTVATYRGRLMEKLQLRSTADLLRYAVEHRLARE